MPLKSERSPLPIFVGIVVVMFQLIQPKAKLVVWVPELRPVD